MGVAQEPFHHCAVITNVMYMHFSPSLISPLKICTTLRP